MEHNNREEGMYMAIRTDLAVEALEDSRDTGAYARQSTETIEGLMLTQVDIFEETELGKPPGRY